MISFRTRHRNFRLAHLNPMLVCIVAFLIAWLPVLLLTLLGIKSRDNNTMTVLNNLAFIILIIVLPLLFIYKKAPKFVEDGVISERYRSYFWKRLEVLILTSGVASLIGIILLAYDRIKIKGINYSVGARAARYQWLAHSNITTLFGFVGNLLVPFSYIALFMTLFYYERANKRAKMLGLCAGFVVPFTHAFLNGARMNLLVVVLVVAAVGTLRYIVGKTFVPKMSKLLIMLAILVTVLYVLSIFSQSRSFGSLNLSEFTDLQVRLLDGVPTKEYSLPIINRLIQTFSYMYHGKWVTGTVMQVDSAERYGFYSYVGVNTIVSRFGVKITALQHNAELFHGAFLNVPGTIYYDFGLIGVFLIPFLLSFVVYNTVIRFCYRTRRTYGTILRLFFLLMFLLSSPIAPILNLGYVNFMFVAFLMTWVLTRYVWGLKIWLTE